MPNLASKDLGDVAKQWELLPRARPLVLLPLRLETRFEAIGTDRWRLKLRVFPDALHAEVTPAALSEAERLLGVTYWQDGAGAGAFTALAAACGGPWRALAIADATGVAPGPTTAAPTACAALLPKQWVAVVVDSKGVGLEVRGLPIPANLALHPSWEALADDSKPLDAAGLPPGDPARWMVDFDAAVAVGMGLYIDLPEGRERMRSLVVIGIRGDDDDGEELAGLLRSHLRHDGLGLELAGTPTNNTDDEPAGAAADAAAYASLTRKDRRATGAFSGSLLHEDAAAQAAPTRKDAGAPAAVPGSRQVADATPERRLTPALLPRGASAGVALARALGLRESVLPLLPDAGLRLDERRAAALHVVRVAALEPWLRLQGADDEQTQAIGAWFEAWVRPDGPLPLLRVGKQPYGVLPVGGALSSDTALERDIGGVLARLRAHWAGAVELVPRVDPSADDSTADRAAAVGGLAAVLQRHPDPTLFTLRDLEAPSLAPAQDRPPTIASTLRALAELQSTFMAAVNRLAVVLRPAYFGHSTALAAVLSAKTLARQSDAAAAFLKLAAADVPPELKDWRDRAVTHVKALQGHLKRAQEPEALLTAAGLPAPCSGPLTVDSPVTLELTPQERAGAWRGGLVGDLAWIPALAKLLREEDAPPEARSDQPLWQQILLLHGKGLVTACKVALLNNSVPGGYRRRRDRLCEALDRLAAGAPGEVEALLRAALGACIHRLDAWVTGLATSRLSRQASAQLREPEGAAERIPSTPAASRQASAQRKEPEGGCLVGGFACAFDLRPDDHRTPAAGGHVLTPSLTHARMAALLRSGFAAYGDAAGLAVDLSSDRVRLARGLFDGVRQGRSLGELLGERFERRLHTSGAADLIPEFRRAVLAGLGQADAPPHAIVDGFVLARARRAAWQAGQELDASERVVEARVRTVGDGREGARIALAELDEALDALADTSLADALHGLMEGDTERVRATLEAVDRGKVQAPQLEGLALQRGGPAVHHQVALLLPAAPATAGPGLGALVEPRLDAWLATIVGAGQRFGFAAIDAAGAVRGFTATIAELGGGPLDLVALAPGGVLAGSALERLLLAHVGDLAPDAGSPTTRIDPLPTSREVPALAELLAVAGWVQQALMRAVPCAPEHLAAAPGAVPPALVELATDAERRARLVARLASVAALALRAAPPSASELAQARLLLGLLCEDPSPSPPTRDVGLRAWLGAATAAALSRVEATPPTAGALGRLLGDWVPALRCWQAPASASWLWKATPGARRWAPPVAQGAAVTRWIDLLGPTRPALGALSALILAAEALGGAPAAPLAYQSPARGEWAAVKPPVAGGPRTDTTSLVLIGPRPDQAVEALCGVVIDGFTERVPEAEVGGGLTFHWDAPVARAPQAILVAVQDPGKAWAPRALADLVADTVQRARERMVGPEDLLREPTTGLGHFLPAVAIPDGVTARLGLGLAVADLSTAFQGAERLTVLKPTKGVP